LPSIECLSASEGLCRLFIGIVFVDLQIFGSAQTLQPESFILIDLRKCFIDYLRFGLSAIEISLELNRLFSQIRSADSLPIRVYCFGFQNHSESRQFLG
jgi:hypothetical protein